MQKCGEEGVGDTSRIRVEADPELAQVRESGEGGETQKDLPSLEIVEVLDGEVEYLERFERMENAGFPKKNVSGQTLAAFARIDSP